MAIDYKSLPVYAQKQKILDCIENNQVVIVESPTGSGKTTQIPVILYEAGYATNGMIGVTQPRRIAALSVSEFISKQLGTTYPGLVGYKMRFEDQTNQDTRIKIMTDGILLQEMKLDPWLSKYSVLMIDEAHDRSLNIDFDNGDDNVAIKSGRDDDGRQDGKASENIIIRKCRFKGLHGVVIGSEMSGGVRNVWVDSCTASGYCKRGIYIKTNPDRGGEIRNINVTNTRFEDVEDLYLATSQYAGEGKDSQHFTVIEGLKVDGLSCRKAKRGGLILDGTEAEPIRNAEFRNVTIEETPIGISFNRTEGVVLQDCNIGGRVESVPTMAK